MASKIHSLRRRTRTLWLMAAGRVRARRGREHEARRLFERAVLLSPERYQTHYRLGLAMMACGDLEQALHRFRIAYALCPHRFLSSRAPVWVRERVVVLEHRSRAEESELPWFEDVDGEEPFFDFAPADSEGEAVAGDFSGVDEWMRFVDRPPVSRREIQETDLDALLERLSASPEDEDGESAA